MKWYIEDFLEELEQDIIVRNRMDYIRENYTNLPSPEKYIVLQTPFGNSFVKVEE